MRALIRATITANLASVAFSFFGGAGATLPPGFDFRHSGGVIGGGARRTERRALRYGERFAVLEDGEEVLTRRDPRHRWNIGNESWPSVQAWVASLGRYHEGGIVGRRGGAAGAAAGGGQAPPIEFRVINETGVRARPVDDGMRFDGTKWVQSVILRDARDNGPITQAMRRTGRV